MMEHENGWRSLREHAARQLGGDFAGRVLREARTPSRQAWNQLMEHGADCLRPGFAERVLAAFRRRVPTLGSQLAFSTAVAVFCFLMVILLNDRISNAQERENLARWQQIVSEAQYMASQR